MKSVSRSVVAVALAAVSCAGLAADLAAERAEALSLIKQFGGTLKSELQQAIKRGGPTEAIGVCNQRAPEIAASVSRSDGWQVGRTSLKIRNADNAPDAWERQVLQEFERRKAAGEAPEKIDHLELVEVDGRRTLRYMKAIPTAEVCTNCHGVTVPAPVEAKLKVLYPHDQARGFEVGDIRGAFTLSKTLAD